MHRLGLVIWRSSSLLEAFPQVPSDLGGQKQVYKKQLRCGAILLRHRCCASELMEPRWEPAFDMVNTLWLRETTLLAFTCPKYIPL